MSYKKSLIVAVCAAALFFLLFVLPPGDGPEARQSIATYSPGYDEGPLPPSINEDRYLTFQIFVDDHPKLWEIPSRGPPGEVHALTKSREAIENVAKSVTQTIGETGQDGHKLGFMLGPLAMDYTDEQNRELIRIGFGLADKYDVAIGFHIDDSMFWYKRPDLWKNIENIEWTGWEKTPNTGRRLDWGTPRKLAPQMCFNSPDIKNEVRRLAREVYGPEIKRGVASLKAKGKEGLFAGVIVGWETQMGRDFDTDKDLGYCALTNKGYSKTNPPREIDVERERIVKEFIDMWTSDFVEAGLDKDKLYSHVAFQSHRAYQERMDKKEKGLPSYPALNNFAEPAVAFGPNHRPGFSTYPAPGLFRDIYTELLEHPTSWASSEGTNVMVGMLSGEDTMETYLARHFNHGAALVNIFGWAGGGENAFTRATRNDEAIAAYRKFLRGRALAESPIPLAYGLPAKVKKIQALLPGYLKSGGNPAEVDARMRTMWDHIRKNDVMDAERSADSLIKLIESKPRN